MAQTIKVGTQLDPHQRSLDVYVVERITKTATGFRITAHTLAQRAYGLTGSTKSMTTWTDTELQAQVSSGKLTVRNEP